MRSSATAFKFQPFSKKQKQVLTWWMPQSPYRDYDMIIADGSIRSGKTIAMIDGFLTWSLETFRHQNFILSGRTMGALKRNVLRPAFQILAAKGIPYRYNRSEHFVQIGTNTYYCFGANNEAAQDVLQGLTAAGAYGDEAALFPQSFVEQMIGRCSVEGSKIWLNCNPAGPYHYLKTDYIDKAEEKRILRLHFTLDDNLTLSEQIKERYRRMFTGVFYKRYVLGLWVMAEGVVYDMWDEDVHVVDNADLPGRFRRHFVAVDYGTGNPTTFLLFGEAENGVLYQLDEYYWDSRARGRQKEDSEYADDFQKWLPAGLTPAAILVDPSAASFITTLKNRRSKDPRLANVRQADNEVVDGIRRVATRLSQKRLFVHRRCLETRKEFAAYAWDPKAQQRGEDKPLKENDHCMDPVRYMVNHLDARNDVLQTGRLELANW